jgi:hypothetical protein
MISKVSIGVYMISEVQTLKISSFPLVRLQVDLLEAPGAKESIGIHRNP